MSLFTNISIGRSGAAVSAGPAKLRLRGCRPIGQCVRIFAWANNHSGCGQYRIGMPMWALGRMGHDTTPFSVLNTELPEDLDVLVGQQVCGPERSERWLEIARQPVRAMAMVYEMDDDVWSVHPTNPAFAGLHEPGLLPSLEACLAVADAATVTTDHLAEVVSRFNPNVHVLPNCIDQSLLEHERPRAEKVTIGWAGGSSHENDFASVRGDLRSFFGRNPDVDLHFIGPNFGPMVGRPDARNTPWSTNIGDYLKSIDFDIGIAPLAYHRFNKSKSDLKALEFAALGIPVVASNFGPYPDSIEHGVTGFLVKHPHEWSKYLRALVNDEAMRTEMGANAKRWAATRTIQANAWRWEQTYTLIYAGRLAALLQAAGTSL
jgi:glycosyltransferase involved in cell wall biosynthesis